MTIESFLADARSVLTLVSMFTFLGIAWWAYSARRRDDFDAAARLPFADEPDTPAGVIETERSHG